MCRRFVRVLHVNEAGDECRQIKTSHQNNNAGAKCGIGNKLHGFSVQLRWHQRQAIHAGEVHQGDSGNKESWAQCAEIFGEPSGRDRNAESTSDNSKCDRDDDGCNVPLHAALDFHRGHACIVHQANSHTKYHAASHDAQCVCFPDCNCETQHGRANNDDQGGYRQR